MNSLHVITPYKHGGQWMFDDSTKGLQREPFVSGTDTIMQAIADEHGEFSLIFSDREFPGYNYRFDWVSHHMNGDWYTNDVWGKGWLCPALLKYFDVAPAFLYVKIK